jgi:hypothetical protein
MHAKDLFYFLVGVILPTYNLLEWMWQHFSKQCRRWYMAIKIARHL